MVSPLASPKACRFCLSTDNGGLRLIKSPTDIIDFLIGREPDLAELWLCCRCSHTMKKICLFRDLCSRSHAVLQEYSSIHNSNVTKNYFQVKKETFSQGRNLEPSLSNTLCMSIAIESFQSPVYIESFNKNRKPPKNYTDNITRFYEENLQIETELGCDPFESSGIVESSPEIVWSSNAYDVKLEGPSSSPRMDEVFKTLPEESSNKIESKKEKCETARDNESYSDISAQSSCNETYSIQTSNKFTSCLSKEKVPSCHTKASSLEKILPIKNRYSKTVTDEIDKAYAARLTLEEQLKEKEDRAKEESYIRASFKCELCVLTFQSQLAIVNHKKKHLESRGPQVCPVCSIRFPKFENLDKHRESHSIRFICHICEQRFYNRNSFKNHLIWHSGEFKCSECGKDFTDRNEMKKHIAKEHPNRRFECKICGKIISSKATYLIHLQRHKGIPTHICNICSKGFYSEPNLYLHLETHKENKPLHYCVECDRYFKSLNILKTHLKYAMPHRDISILKYKCSDCPKTFHSLGTLAHHKSVKHEGPHKYVCDECGANYGTRCGLIKHIKYVHQGHQLIKRFPCTVCEKAFSAKVMLVTHTRVHTGERPFKCSHCPNSFTQKSALGTHIKLVHLKLKRIIGSKKKINSLN